MAVYWKMPHKADLYSKSFVVNDAGQRYASWTYDSTHRCQYAPQGGGRSYSNIFVGDVYAALSQEIVCFEANVPVDYEKRIYNIKDRYGNIIGDGPYEIIKILSDPGFSGRVHHHYVIVEKVKDE